VTWRQGTRATNGNPDAAMTSWFLAIRARPANRDIPRGPDGALPDCWLLAEWPPKADEPTGYWLSPLPADTAIEELVRLAKIRWRVEHDYREPKWISSGQSRTIQNDLTSYSSGTHEERRPRSFITSTRSAPVDVQASVWEAQTIRCKERANDVRHPA
jgi:hypothetical protein